jgi:two-component system cell cycle sensor histidine kinase/response regulator CckA
MAETTKKTLETILVVDDVDLVLGLVVMLLKDANFNVLQANSGAQALKVAAEYPGKIDLLLSDVKMPQMSGPALGTALKLTRKDIHVMFMSAFPGGDLLVLNYGWSYIEKPFVKTTLLEMVNTVLHTPDKAQGTHQFDIRKDTDRYKKIEAGQTPPPDDNK